MKKQYFKRLFLIPVIVTLISTGIAYGSDEPVVKESALSYGMIKKHVKSGTTSQLDIVKLFGSPDNMVLKKGKETWIYDRFKIETSVLSESSYGSIIIAGSKSSKLTSSSIMKNITVIIEFSEDGIVEDLSMRVGGY
ncbi:MAG: hypothetical protein Q7K13_02440 [Polynucleobacter sp.]|uniref:hypothetical protein n=1 Tax=Polynucleobacter sp. TaxID=2029855 RepID=UPI0027247367|nr:hypothetical protein [Polynucleobacter sp.]MDO8713323.1 hypothetical protein [Polynucleobacter sp.]